MWTSGFWDSGTFNTSDDGGVFNLMRYLFDAYSIGGTRETGGTTAYLRQRLLGMMSPSQKIRPKKIKS